MRPIFFPAVLSSVLGFGPALHSVPSGASLLEQTSQAFTHIAEQAMPATVFIKAETLPSQDRGQAAPLDLFGDEFFRRFFGGQQPFPSLQPQPQISGGSGFLITEDGYIVTNNHVVHNASAITVTLNDGREYSASVKGTDEKTDLALLKIEEKNLPFLRFGDSETLKVGEWVVAIGNPLGIGATLTVGIVSAKGRQDLGIASYEDFIQTDAPINPGNSGGPLFNLQGEVIGVNTAIYTKSGGYMGIGFSIPSQIVQNIIDQILTTGGIQRAYLGVVLQPVDKDLANALELEKQEGALIAEVVKESPAFLAGLQQGDIILYCNGKPIKSVSKLRNEIAMTLPGNKITLEILRDHKKKTLCVALGSLEGEGGAFAFFQKLGMDVESLSAEMASRLGYKTPIEGVAISQVKPGTPAAMAGLRPGFVITGVALNINQAKAVKSRNDLEEAIREIGDKKHIIFIVRHQNMQRYYTVKIN